jgi:hypothetical protein
MTTKQLNQRQVRWAEFLSQFNFIITYRPNNKATLPDTLSRLPGSTPVGLDNDRLRHRHRIMIPHEKINPTILEELLHNPRDPNGPDSVTAVEVAVVEKTLEELIRQAYQEDEFARDMVATL